MQGEQQHRHDRERGVGGEFVGRAHYDNKYVKVDGRWYFEEMSLTYLRGKGEIKKLADDCANAYKVFLL